MSAGVRRRLDVLILLCSALLGVALTYLALSPRVGLRFFVFALFPTALVAASALGYANSG
ncbi:MULTISPECIES: hypothetical protein [Halorubrum]|uniref:Uncharacterized protein n=1 Tax=Halorubrum sodomense TaxID=35743 RepID=A0A1I6GWP2_HALSD|nr:MULTISPECIES: hypothetical protein [Halorubrum]TKX54787.1 hypothetical protein EXE42_06645 [Halorubrum sp. SP3]TKX69896.1 hypothetical protein EXE45_06795 [Halorubrum sp. SP9]SFR46683.1 hypothetical protein SAMN04487937_2141 [Halorubrum sodomense]